MNGADLISLYIAATLVLILLWIYNPDAVIVGIVSSIAAGLIVSTIRHTERWYTGFGQNA